MTLRTSPDVIFTPGDDFTRVDRGIEWGLKVTHIGDAKFVTIFHRPANGSSWGATNISELDWQTEVTDMNVREWFSSRAMPRLQAWMRGAFPAQGTGGDGGSTGNRDLDLSHALDAFIVQKLRVSVNPDGTLTASLRD